MTAMEKDFELAGMPVSEYERFWGCFMAPVLRQGNVVVYEIRETPAPAPEKLPWVPGISERHSL